MEGPGARVQPKLSFDGPGDPFEAEADQVADLVMRMPQPGTDAGAGCCSGCAAGGSCSDEAGVVQRSTSAHNPSRTSIDSQTESTIRSGGSGGQPLPDTTRAFYEARFGQNFSDVRVHQGHGAAAASESINAHAFTHGQHVWLGAGVGTEPSHVLAHELTHVVQQRGGSGAPDDGVHRFAPYWEPQNMRGTQEHSRLLPDMSSLGGIFIEAPIANANKTGHGYARTGRADLYDASTTLGVTFHARGVPRRLADLGQLRFRGTRHGLPDPAPVPGPLQSVREVDRAPTSITVGDLKPSHGTLEALEGTTQLDNYALGIQMAASEVNEMAERGVTKPTDARWHPHVGKFSRGALAGMIPPEHEFPGTAQAAEGVVLKQGGEVIKPLIRTTAKLIVEPDPTNDGIVNYVWVEQGLTPTPVPTALAALAGDVLRRLITPLRQPITPVRRKAKVDPVPVKRKPQTAKVPKVQRAAKDTFDLGQWRTDRQRITSERRAMRGGSDLRTGEQAALVVDQQKAAARATGLALPEPAQSTKDTAAAYERVDFWTSTPAGIFGTLRRLFGTTFVRVSEAYDRMRERFRGWLRGRRASGGGGGLLGAAVKVLFKVLKMAGLAVVNRTLSVLQDSLVQGVTRKLTALVPEENMLQMQASLQHVNELHEQMVRLPRLTAESVIGTVFPGVENVLGRLERVQEIVSDFCTIVNLVRWGARAVACLSPPALGCLWALVQEVLERIAARIIDTCWFQKKVTPFVLRLSYVREELPRQFAQSLIGAIRSVLPPSLHDVFADVTTTPPDSSDVECDDEGGGGGAELDDNQRAVLDLQTRLGEERFLALMELLRRRGVPGGVPLTRTRAEQLAQLVDGNGVSADALRRLAAQQPGGTRVPLEQAIDQLRGASDRSPIEPIQPPEPSGTAESDDEALEDPRYQTTVVGSTDEPSRSREGRDALAANAHSGDVSGRPVQDWSSRVREVRGSLTVGSTVEVFVRLTSRDGRRIRDLNRLQARVTSVAPSERQPGRREAILEVTHDQRFAFPRGEAYGYMEQQELTWTFQGR